MGLPFPPTWEPGPRCETCEDVMFDGATPVFVYAYAQDLVKCPGVPPVVPDPNRVVRMTQVPGSPCFWSGMYHDGVFHYNYAYWFTNVNTFMHIDDISMMQIFDHVSAPPCQDHLTNQLVCGAPWFPAFSGGTVDCFW